MLIPVYRPTEILAVMDRCGVARIAASSFRAIRQDASAGNDEAAAVVEHHPDRYAGAMVINPWQDPETELSRWADDPRMSVIKLHPDVHEYPLDGPRYRPVWEFALRTGCPVLTHTWHGSDFDGWPQVGRVCERYPGLHLIAGHSAVLPGGLDDGVELARRHQSLYLELCGSFSHSRYVARLVRDVGAGQVLYGSDSPFIEMRSALGRLVFSELSDDELEQVLAGTMAGLLGWRQPGVGGPAPADR